MILNENISISPLILGDNRLDQVEALFRTLYDSEKNFGVTITLIEGGEKIWRKNIEKVLGKFVQIIVATEGDIVVGFSYGSIKMLPSYFGGILTGYWEAMFVKPEYRNMGLSDRMTMQLINWWMERGVSVYEGERLIANEYASRSFERLGFKKELIKYRRKA
jgi:GNAT superfamily N-acetyltransferase